MTMIKKVARAIQSRMLCNTNLSMIAAKAAIEAIRDIDDHVLDAGAYDLDMTLRMQWENIIDAVLKED